MTEAKAVTVSRGDPTVYHVRVVSLCFLQIGDEEKRASSVWALIESIKDPKFGEWEKLANFLLFVVAGSIANYFPPFFSLLKDFIRPRDNFSSSRLLAIPPPGEP